LAPEHYYRGPDADDDGSPGNVMVFLYPYKGMALYIKLKIWTYSQGDAGIVMSFHQEGAHE